MSEWTDIIVILGGILAVIGIIYYIYGLYYIATTPCYILMNQGKHWGAKRSE